MQGRVLAFDNSPWAAARHRVGQKDTIAPQDGRGGVRRGLAFGSVGFGGWYALQLGAYSRAIAACAGPVYLRHTSTACASWSSGGPERGLHHVLLVAGALHAAVAGYRYSCSPLPPAAAASSFLLPPPAAALLPACCPPRISCCVTHSIHIFCFPFACVRRPGPPASSTAAPASRVARSVRQASQAAEPAVRRRVGRPPGEGQSLK